MSWRERERADNFSHTLPKKYQSSTAKHAGGGAHVGDAHVATIKLDGIVYEIVKRRNFKHHGKYRVEMTLRRPRGKRMYYVVLYENGSFSFVVGRE